MTLTHPVEPMYEVRYDFSTEKWMVHRNGRHMNSFDLKEPAKKWALKHAEREGGKYRSYAKERKPRIVDTRDFTE